MVLVEFLGPIGRDKLEIEANSLKELAKILSKDEEIAKWLPKCAVAVNDTIVTNKDTKLEDGDRVSILPPVCGG